MRKKTVTDLTPEALSGRTVFVRVDFNVPLADDGSVQDDTRIRRSLPTLQYLLERGARVVLASHLGRPKGAPDPAFSLAPAATRLGRLMGMDVAFSPSAVGPEAEKAVAALTDGDVLVLENTRFLPGETSNDPELAQSFASLCDLYVNDAFGAAHRAHASTAGIAEVVRARGGEAVAGLLMERELTFLAEALADPQRPFVAVLGGAKISGKIDVIDALLPRVDRLLIGGAMANTFFRALGLSTGASLVEEDRVEIAHGLLERAADKILLPVDCVVGDRIADDTPTRDTPRSDVRPEEVIGDIGPRSSELFREELSGARTIVWNGPMGVFEAAPFRHGTLSVARAIADAADAGALTVVGGGDSAAAAEAAGVANHITHISTGGGASLELLAGAALPGVEALSDAQEEST